MTVLLRSRSVVEEQPLRLTAELLFYSEDQSTGCGVPNSSLCETVRVLEHVYYAEQQLLLQFQRSRVVVYTAPICGGTGGTVLCADRASVR
jgi:predicted nucleic-acid-binding protein